MTMAASADEQWLFARLTDSPQARTRSVAYMFYNGDKTVYDRLGVRTIIGGGVYIPLFRARQIIVILNISPSACDCGVSKDTLVV